MALMAALLVRWQLVRAARRLLAGSDGKVAHAHRFAITTALSGIVWGAAGLFVLVPQGPETTVLTITAIQAMVMGGVVTLAAHLPAFLAFAVPAMLPLVVALLSKATTSDALLAVYSVVFLLLMIGIARRFNHSLRQRLGLMLDKEALIDALGHAHRDLTSEMKVSEHRAAELAMAKGELEQFAYAAAHDLQEPVRTISCYTQLLKYHLGDMLDTEAQESMAHIVNGAHRIRTQLHDIEVFLAEDRTVRPPAAVSAETALDRALRHLESKRATAGATIIRDPLPCVMADPHRLREVFKVLIANAIEYRHPNRAPVVRIGARRDGAVDVLFVQDNGIGIAPIYHEQIFQVFRRLHTRDEHPGTGMGLAIARKMAKALGGDIAVDSRLGEGSTFMVRLPSASHRQTS